MLSLSFGILGCVVRFCNISKTLHDYKYFLLKCVFFCLLSENVNHQFECEKFGYEPIYTFVQRYFMKSPMKDISNNSLEIHMKLVHDAHFFDDDINPY